MLANFYLMAKYCDGAIYYSDTTSVNTTTMCRPRFTLNMVIDQSKTASEWISQICACMRANVYYTEGIFWLDIDQPKLMTQMFNMTNITDYTQTATSFRDIPNSYEVQWINHKTDYEIDSFKLEDVACRNCRNCGGLVRRQRGKFNGRSAAVSYRITSRYYYRRSITWWRAGWPVNCCRYSFAINR